jgi:hypothetical protein
MTKIKCLVSVAAAALAFTAWAGIAPASTAKVAIAAERPAPAAPTKAELVALEKTAFEAWKSKDKIFWATFFSDKFVGYGSPGRLDRASAITEYGNADCDIKGYALSDERVKPLGRDAGLLTFKATIDGTCGGQQVPVSRAAAVFVREGGTWKSAFYADTPIVDPRAAASNPADAGEATRAVVDKPSARDAGTQALLRVEKAVWEAWRARDAHKLENLTASDISFINIFGTYLPTKAEALKDWSGTGCDVKSVSVSDAAATMLSPAVGILTFTGNADGTCYGQRVGPIRGTSVYVKDGAAWKWTFGMNLPAPSGGS